MPDKNGVVVPAHVATQLVPDKYGVVPVHEATHVFPLRYLFPVVGHAETHVFPYILDVDPVHDATQVVPDKYGVVPISANLRSDIFPFEVFFYGRPQTKICIFFPN